jgi:hypothetical protein
LSASIFDRYGKRSDIRTASAARHDVTWDVGAILAGMAALLVALGGAMKYVWDHFCRLPTQHERLAWREDRFIEMANKRMLEMECRLQLMEELPIRVNVLERANRALLGSVDVMLNEMERFDPASGTTLAMVSLHLRAAFPLLDEMPSEMRTLLDRIEATRAV